MALPEYRGKRRLRRGLLRRTFVGMLVKTAFLTGIFSSMSSGQAHNLRIGTVKKVRRSRFRLPVSSRGYQGDLRERAQGLFGSVEIPGGTSQAFRKWQAVLPQCDKQLLFLQQCLDGTSRCAGAADYWYRIIRGVGKTHSLRQLSLLNTYINESAGYDPQSVLAGPADIWRAPLQFLGFKGDCEDYAISKYFSLLALGYPEESLRFIVVKDDNRSVIHAVTSVQLGEQRYVLDSLRPVATKETALAYYQPLVSMSRNRHFTHLRTDEMRESFLAHHRRN